MSVAATPYRPDWQTPPAIVRLIQAFDEIALDPCGAPNNPCGAGRLLWQRPEGHTEFFVNTANDGLLASWNDLAFDGLVYVNPPYDALAEWTRKCALEAGHGAEIILLCPPRLETKWWREGVVEAASAIAFWRGGETLHHDLAGSRIRFVDPTGKGRSQPRDASAFVYYGKRVNKFMRHFAPFAWVVVP